MEMRMGEFPTNKEQWSFYQNISQIIRISEPVTQQYWVRRPAVTCKGTQVKENKETKCKENIKDTKKMIRKRNKLKVGNRV